MWKKFTISFLALVLVAENGSGLAAAKFADQHREAATPDLPLSADQAYNFGCYSIADQLYRKLLEETLTGKTLRAVEPICRRLATIAIGRGDFLEADRLLQRIRNEDDSTLLLKALASLAENRLDEDCLGRINVENLRPQERAWYYTLASDAAERHDFYGQSREFWELARQNATDGTQLLSIEELRLTLALLLRPANETLEERLRTKLRSYNWRVEGVNSVKRYAIVLHRLGRSRDALDVLRRQISMLPIEAGEAAQELRILEALIGPANDENIGRSLEKMLRDGAALEWEQAALKLLLGRARETGDLQRLEKFLASIDGRSDNRNFLLTRLQLALLEEAWPRAQTLALKLLALGGTAREQEGLQSLWLRLTLEKTAPDYSKIAAMLETAEATTMDSGTRASILLSLAKHFQSQTNFALAEKFYGQLLALGTDHCRWEGLKHSSLNYLALGDYGRALAILESCLAEGEMAPDDESFDFLRSFQSAAEDRRQLEELNNLLRRAAENFCTDRMDSAFYRNLLLRQAENFHRLADLDRCNSALDRLFLLEETARDRTLLPAALLLRCRLLYEADRDGEADELLAELRKNFPKSSEANESYFLRCRRLHDLRKPGEAIAEMEQNLARCRGRGDGDGEAKSLLELARLQREKNPADYHSALAALEQLQGNQFPPELAHFARVQQAEILRGMGDFATAARVYENLIRDSSGSLDRLPVEYNLAKCYLALAHGPTSRWLTRAICHLRKLQRMPTDDSNLAIEMAYSLTIALKKAGQRTEESLLLWEIWSNYALRREGRAQLNSTGQFWLRATGAALLDHLDPKLDRPAIDSILLILKQIDGTDH